MEATCAVPQNIQSLLTRVGLPPKIVKVEKYWLVLQCPICGAEFKKLMSLLSWAERHRAQVGLTCSRYCGRKRLLAIRPDAFAAGVAALMAFDRSTLAGVPMPPRTREHREKLSQALRGRSPTVRAGNGSGLTPAEGALAPLLLPLGFQWNLAVSLGKRVPGYPTNYKLDFGHQNLKVGLEVDGRSHLAEARIKQDLKKERKLQELGWKIFRIKNTQALSPSGILRLEDVRTILPEMFLCITAPL